MLLTVPILVKGRFNQNINEVKVDNNSNWWRSHWRSLELNYTKADYFESYRDFFEGIYKKRWEKLVDLNWAIIEFLLKDLGINKEIALSSNLNFTSGSTDLLIEMCRKFNGDTFLSGEQAKTYVDLEKFKVAGLKHIFMKFYYPTYKQLHGDFIPNLSIIDALFNCGSEETRRLLENNIEFEK